MGDCVDADVEADENSAFMDVRDGSGIFTLNLALAQIFLAGVSVYALDVCLYRDVFKGVELDTQDADKAEAKRFRFAPIRRSKITGTNI